MMLNKELLIVKNILIDNNYTCVLGLNGTEVHSSLRGVKPLIDFLESDRDFRGFCAADKVVGAGAAHLYVLLGVRAVWANVISKEAKRILESNGIFVSCNREVVHIINRSGDGLCPIETAVTGIDDHEQSLLVIKQTLKELIKS